MDMKKYRLQIRKPFFPKTAIIDCCVRLPSALRRLSELRTHLQHEHGHTMQASATTKTLITISDMHRILIRTHRTHCIPMALFLLLLLSVTFNLALSARIIGFSALGGSKYLNTRHIMEELASRGHEVENDFCTAMHA